MDKKSEEKKTKTDVPAFSDFSALKKDLQDLKDSLKEREQIEKKIVWDKINLMER